VTAPDLAYGTPIGSPVLITRKGSQARVTPIEENEHAAARLPITRGILQHLGLIGSAGR